MQRIEINIHEKELCIKLVIYKNCTEMHDQQNIKFCIILCCTFPVQLYYICKIEHQLVA